MNQQQVHYAFSNYSYAYFISEQTIKFFFNLFFFFSSFYTSFILISLIFCIYLFFSLVSCLSFSNSTCVLFLLQLYVLVPFSSSVFVYPFFLCCYPNKIDLKILSLDNFWIKKEKKNKYRNVSSVRVWFTITISSNKFVLCVCVYFYFLISKVNSYK